MIQLIAPAHQPQFTSALSEMHRLRHRVFKERLDWGVETRNGWEMDRFDALSPVYLLQRSSDERIQGCVRLLPSIGPNMLRDVFPELLAGKSPPADPAIWESSRFAVDLPGVGHGQVGGLAQPTVELFAGMIEFGLSQGLIDIVTVTDIRVERLLRRAAWPLRRIAEPQTIGSTTAVAGYLEVSLQALASVRLAGELSGPVLWQPVLGPG
jgi:acyl homoserine lactone synthase